MDRRTALGGISTCATGLIAGCFGIGDQSMDPIRLCRVVINNRADERLKAEFRLTEDDTVLVEQSEAIPPAEGSVVDGFTVPDETLPADPGYYRVHMRIAGEAWEELYLPEIDSHQVSITGEITPTPHRDQSPSMVIFQSTDPDYC